MREAGWGKRRGLGDKVEEDEEGRRAEEGLKWRGGERG